MKTVKLKVPTRVNLDAGTVVTVSDYEAWRLSAFGLAEEVKDETKDDSKSAPEESAPEESAPKPATEAETKATTKKSTPKK